MAARLAAPAIPVPPTSGERMARTRSEKRIASALSTYVRDKYDAAVTAADPHHGDMMECLNLLRGVAAHDVVDPDSLDLNIVAPLVQGVVSMMQDVLGSTKDKPYLLKSTPIPELPDTVREQLVDAVQENLPALLEAAGGDTDRVVNAISSLRQTLLKAENSRAQEAAANMEELVSDRLVDAGWTDQFLDFIANFVAYPMAVMKAPVTVIRAVKRWNGQRLVFNKEEIELVESISPFDFFPSPNARDVQSAEYVCERRRLTSTQLLDLATVEGYDSNGIDAVFKEHPDGFAEKYSDGLDDAPDTDNDTDEDAGADCRGTYDAVGFYGRIPGKYLTMFGVDLDDDREWHEAEVWLVGEEVIHAQLNPDPMGMRPFYTASMYATPGSIYGSCVPLRLADTQRVCTASARALVRNMAYASGPIGEVNPDAVVDDEDPRIVVPHLLRMVKPSYNGAASIHFHNVDSHSSELMNVFNNFLNMAYEIIGIPRVAFGSPNGLGAIGRTSGGLSILMNQAAKPIKLAMREIERRIVEPVVQHFVDTELMYNDDPTIKGDIKVQAQGLSGIEAKEEQTERLTWALQSLSALPEGVVSPQAIERLLYYIFEAYGIPTKGILPDFGMEDALSNDLGMSFTQGGGGGNVGQAMATAPLDGRSEAAAQTIQNANGGPTTPPMIGA